MRYLQLGFLIAVLLFVVSCKEEAEVKTGFVAVGKLHIFYERQGEGESLLLLHAGLQDHKMWDAQVDELKNDFDVIRIDLPAHGQSTGFDTTVFTANAIAEILSELGVSKASVVGLSLGSSAAVDFVITHPDKVNKLILAAPGLTGWQQVLQPPDSISSGTFNQLDSAFVKKVDSLTAEAFTHAWCDGPFRNPNDVDRNVRNYIKSTTYSNLTEHNNDSWLKFSKLTGAERAHTITSRTLIIFSDKDVPFIKAVADWYVKTIPNATKTEIKNAAHMLNMEQPGEFNRILSEFLRHH